MGRLKIYNTDEADMFENENLPHAFNEKYAQTKAKKERQLKNRKKRREVENHDPPPSR
jgi:hypothetical protein